MHLSARLRLSVKRWRDAWLLIFLGAFFGGVVAVVVLVCVLWFGLKWWLKSKVAGLSEQLAAMGQSMNAVPPIRIRLLPGADEDWDDTQAKPLYQPLIDREFVDAGSYHTEDDPPYAFGVKALVHEQQGIMGAVFHHVQVGYWAEVLSRFPDKTSMTYSTNHDPLADYPDYKTIHYAPGTGAGELLDQFLWVVAALQGDQM